MDPNKSIITSFVIVTIFVLDFVYQTCWFSPYRIFHVSHVAFVSGAKDNKDNKLDAYSVILKLYKFIYYIKIFMNTNQIDQIDLLRVI